MKLYRFLLIPALFCSPGLLSTVYSQCAYLPASLEQRVANAHYIVLGKVISKEIYPDPVTGNIQTLNRLKVTAWLKNRQQVSEVYIITLGGIYGNKATKVTPSLQLNNRNEYVLFLEKENYTLDNKSFRRQQPSAIQTSAYADAQGALTLQNGLYYDLLTEKPQDEAVLFSKIQSLTKQAIATPAGERFAPRRQEIKNSISKVLNVDAVTGFSPNPTNAGTVDPADFITITGSGFGAAPGIVEFSNADDGGGSFISPLVASDYVSWSDNSITVKVPDNAGTGPFEVNGMSSVADLTIPYSHLSLNSDFFGFAGDTRQRYYLRNLNTLGGYSFLYNTSFNSNAAAVAAFESALVTWQCGTSVNFRSGGTTATAINGDDGVNAVFFDAGLPAQVLGRAYSHFSASAGGPCTLDNTVWWLTDIDIAFTPDPPEVGFPWNFGPGAPAGNEFDFESVVVHELGHAHGLGHVIVPGAVMHFELNNGVTARSLSVGDIAGGNAKMAYSTAATCFDPAGSGTPMTDFGSCSLPVKLEKFEGQRKNTTTNVLSWTTAQEFNNTGFYIQRSTDGRTFKEIDFVASKGQSHARQEYIAEDINAGGAPWFYRLKQVDIDGSTEYAAIVFIPGSGAEGFRIWSNSPGNVLYVSGSANGALKLYSSTGQLVYNRSITSGLNTVYVDKLPKGVYHYQVITPAQTVAGKVILGGR